MEDQKIPAAIGCLIEALAKMAEIEIGLKEGLSGIDRLYEKVDEMESIATSCKHLADDY